MAPSRDFVVHTRSRFAELGLTFATRPDAVEAHALAVRTVGPNIASIDTLIALQAHTQCASYVLRTAEGVLDGCLSIIPLTIDALPDLTRGVFDGIAPSMAQAARPGQRVIALYGWGMAAVSWRARATILNAAWRLHRDIHPDLPLYGRAATPGGERSLLKRIGAEPVPGPGGLVLAPAWASLRRAA